MTATGCRRAAGRAIQRRRHAIVTVAAARRRPRAPTIRPSPAQYGEGLGAAFATELTARGRAGRTARGGRRRRSRGGAAGGGRSRYHVETAADGEEHSAEVVFTAARGIARSPGAAQRRRARRAAALRVEAAEAHPDGCVLRGGGAAEAVVGEPASSSFSPATASTTGIWRRRRRGVTRRTRRRRRRCRYTIMAAAATGELHGDGRRRARTSHDAGRAADPWLTICRLGPRCAHFAAACAIDVSALAAARVGEKTPVVVRARRRGQLGAAGGDEFRAVFADASGDEGGGGRSW